MSRQSGFTLVEIVIVLAITGGLITLALAGKAGSRDQSKFTDGVETVATLMDSTRTKASTTENANGSGNSIQKINFGNLVEIDAGSNIIKITDIIGTNANQIDSSEAQTLSYGTNITTVNIPWSVRFNSASNLKFVMHRQLESGKLLLYQVSPDPVTGTANDPLTYNYIENVSASSVIAIPLIDQNGRRATVTVDGTHGGAVSRVYY